MNPKDYSQMKELLKMAEEAVDTQREMVNESLTDNNYDPGKVLTLTNSLLSKIRETNKVDETKEEVTTEAVSEDTSELDEKIKEKEKDLIIALVGSKLETEFSNIRKAILLNPDPEGTTPCLEEQTERIKEAFSDMVDYIHTKEDYDKIKALADDEADKLVKYLDSQEYLDKVMADNELDKEKLAKLEEVTGRERNIREIKRLRQKIAVVDGKWDFSFIKESAKVTDKNMVEAFFDDKKSAYILERYYAKCNQLNLTANVFRYFMNIEEKHLDEKYHPFNNFFLFHCVRYMAYLDAIDNEVQFKAIVGTLTKLVYDTFPNDQVKETTINMIKAYLDRFIEEGYTDMFIERNVSYPKHPERLEKDAEREKKAREYYISIIEKNNGKPLSFSEREEYEKMPITDLYNCTEQSAKDAEQRREEEIKEKVPGLYEDENSEVGDDEPEENTTENTEEAEEDSSDNMKSLQPEVGEFGEEKPNSEDE